MIQIESTKKEVITQLTLLAVRHLQKLQKYLKKSVTSRKMCISHGISTV